MGETFDIANSGAVRHNEVRVKRSTSAQQDWINIAIGVRDNRKASATPNAAGTVQGSAGPVTPVLPAVDHDHHAWGARRNAYRRVRQRLGSCHLLTQSQQVRLDR